MQGFNPLPHAEGDAVVHISSTSSRDVSIHSLTQRETLLAFTPPTWYNVSIHSLTQRETQTFTKEDGTKLFQSTPSRRGRHSFSVTFTFAAHVSIHSLTQRETSDTPFSSMHGNVSIHSLTQRETKLTAAQAQQLEVSIHSLTQRETVMSSKRRNRKGCFNPLPHAEGDNMPCCRCVFHQVFQSTPSRRGRHNINF